MPVHSSLLKLYERLEVAIQNSQRHLPKGGLSGGAVVKNFRSSQGFALFHAYLKKRITESSVLGNGVVVFKRIKPLKNIDNTYGNTLGNIIEHVLENQLGRRLEWK